MSLPSSGLCRRRQKEGGGNNWRLRLRWRHQNHVGRTEVAAAAAYCSSLLRTGLPACLSVDLVAACDVRSLRKTATGLGRIGTDREGVVSKAAARPLRWDYFVLAAAGSIKLVALSSKRVCLSVCDICSHSRKRGPGTTGLGQGGGERGLLAQTTL